MNTRYEGWITASKRQGIPHNLLFLDTETEVITDENGIVSFPFKLGVVIHIKIDKTCNVVKRNVEYFTDSLDMINYVLSCCDTKNKLYIFGHNIGFDFRVLSLHDVLERHGFSGEPPIINERVFIYSCKSKDYSICILDTANFGAVSVKHLGESLGYKKLDIDFDEPDFDTLMGYCYRDTEIIERFIVSYLKLIHDNLLGEFKKTLASQSLTAWRTRFMSHPIYIHNYIPSLALERDSYHGGRVECFYIGKLPKQRYYHVDVNSMYPYVMRYCELPTRLINYETNISVVNLRSILSKSYAIARVELQTKTNAYPTMYDKRLIFPIGNFDSILHTRELEIALASNSIKKVLQIAIYDKAIIFSDYIEFFNDIKIRSELSGNKAYRYIAKLFSNSLYGKTGQTNTERTVLASCIPDTQRWYSTTDIDRLFDLPIELNYPIWRVQVKNENTGNSYQEIKWYDNIYSESKHGESYYSFPAIASAVTAYARCILFAYITLAGIQNVFYCDTDSLIVNEQGYNNLSDYISQTELGKLKLEGIADSGWIFGNKDYILGDSYRVKGVPKNATWKTDKTWTYLQFESFLAWLNNRGQYGARGRTINKQRRGVYNKGIIHENGRITPFIL